jgi:translation initiation factor 3 subunit B
LFFIQEIRKNLKEYSKTFERQDEQQTSRVSEQELSRRRRLVEEWKTWRRAGETEYAQARGEVAKYVESAVEFARQCGSVAAAATAAGGDGEVEVVEEWVEEVVEETEEVISK